MTATTQPRPCVRCGAECRGRKHAGDRSGRFWCWECYTILRSEKDASAGSDDGDIGLSPLDNSTLCNGCGNPIAHGVTRCAACGYVRGDPPPDWMHKATGRAATSCRKCKYSLAGLPPTVTHCPECGAVIPRGGRGLRELVAEDVRRAAYRKPILMTAIGCPVTVLLYGVIGMFDPGAASAAEGAVIGALAAVCAIFALSLVTLGVYLTHTMLWREYDGPMHLTVLQITGAAGTALAMGWLFYLLPVWIAGGIWAFLFVVILAESLEADPVDAYLVAMFTAMVLSGIGATLWFL